MGLFKIGSAYNTHIIYKLDLYNKVTFFLGFPDYDLPDSLSEKSAIVSKQLYAS